MLYLVVWELETKGVFSNAVRAKLDEYLAQTKRVNYDSMLNAIRGIIIALLFKIWHVLTSPR